MDITRWSIPKSYSLFFAAKDEETQYRKQKQDLKWTGSDYELFIEKFRLKLKQGKTTRPFIYDLNQIPYDYAVDVTNRFKGLDLVDRVPEELWMEVHNTVQEAVTKAIPKRNKEGKVVVHGGFTNNLRKEEKLKAREKGKDIPS